MAILRPLLDFPRLRARIAGVLYLLIFVAAPSGSASATPAKMAVTLTCDVAVAIIFYDLLRPVSKSLPLVAAFFRLIFVAVMAVTSVNYFAPLLKGEHSSTAFNTGYDLALVFFGIHCFLIGYLIYRSIFLPRVLGVLLVIAGLSYLINSFADFFAPASAHVLWPYIVAPWLVAEGSLTLWLLVIGVHVQRWKQQASGTGPAMDHAGVVSSSN